MSTLNSTIPRWFWGMDTGKIRDLLRKVERLVDIDSSSLVTHRVYIPKADGVRVRSLGVPTPEWRIILSMWTTMLYF